jgi:septal ring factor EnvC (AmiA/AmiB activator)
MALDWHSLQQSVFKHVDGHLPRADSLNSVARSAAARATNISPSTLAPNAISYLREEKSRPNYEQQNWQQLLAHMQQEQQSLARTHRQAMDAMSLQLSVTTRRVDSLERKLAAQEAEAAEAAAAAQRLENAGLQLAARQDHTDTKSAGLREHLAGLSQRVLSVEGCLQGQITPAEAQGIVSALLEPFKIQLEGKLAQVARGVTLLAEGVKRPTDGLVTAGSTSSSSSNISTALAAADQAHLSQRLAQAEGRLQQCESSITQALSTVLRDVEAALQRSSEACAAHQARAVAELQRDIAQLQVSAAEGSSELAKLQRAGAVWDGVEQRIAALRKEALTAAEAQWSDVTERSVAQPLFDACNTLVCTASRTLASLHCKCTSGSLPYCCT